MNSKSLFLILFVVVIIGTCTQETFAPDRYLSLPFLTAKKYQCDVDDGFIKHREFHFRGTSLGGWLVLEPWITPSLFYQFLGASAKWGDDAPNRVAIDSKTFCTALGDVEANRQLRNHWASWVTEDYIAQLSISGVETVRLCYL